MKRRDFLTLSITAPIFLIEGCSKSDTQRADDPEILTAPTTTPRESGTLRIPPLLDPMPLGGIKFFNLEIREQVHTFFDGIDTRTYGMNSSYLGPTLLLRQGDKVSIGFTNTLDQETTMHGHGMHVPAVMDGGPHQVISPGSTWRAEYTVNQNSCTNWYHPHYMGKTAEQVYLGLAGIIIISDNERSSLDLPANYGIDDIPLIIQDRRFDESGQIDYTPNRMEIMQGYKGHTHIVNGKIEPTFIAKAGQLRMRLLNGSNAEVYRIGFNDRRDFMQIAGDNSLLEAPVTMGEILLSPGERAEIIVDLSNDAENVVVLEERSSPGTLLTLFVSQETGHTTPVPERLIKLDRPDPNEAVRTRYFVLSGGAGKLYINGKSMELNRIDEAVPINELEIWEVSNEMMTPHNFHIHATHFLLLERNGSIANVSPGERGYKDTVYLPPNGRVKLLVKMTDYIDANSPYMYHCHFLEHEDAGMMGQFVTV